LNGALLIIALPGAPLSDARGLGRIQFAWMLEQVGEYLQAGVPSAYQSATLPSDS
jgi:hypothetical protein